MDSVSLTLAKSYLGKTAKVTIDRPLGSAHPKWGFTYEANYGFLKGVVAPDGEDLDAYVLKINHPLNSFTGKVVAIVHRLEDDDDKLVVIPENETISDEEITKMVEFQEKFFKYIIVK